MLLDHALNRGVEHCEIAQVTTPTGRGDAHVDGDEARAQQHAAAHSMHHGLKARAEFPRVATQVGAEQGATDDEKGEFRHGARDVHLGAVHPRRLTLLGDAHHVA